MVEPNASPTRRVGGNLTFRTAHEIKDHTDLPFEDAYALANLVLEEGEGPVPSRGKNAAIKKPTETALVQRGLIEVNAWSDFTQRVYVEAITDARIDGLLDAKFAGLKITPIYAMQRAKWSVVATQAAFDLVAKHLPV